MKHVTITEHQFNALFDTTLDKLKLVSLAHRVDKILFDDKAEMCNWIMGLHRQFHYEICVLKEELEKA